MYAWNSDDMVIEARKRRPLFNISCCQLKNKDQICLYLPGSRWYDSERLEACVRIKF